MKIPTFFKVLGDFFLDKNGDGDEKRFFGICFLVYAAVFAWFHPDAAMMVVELAGFGTTLLGLGVLGDKVSPTAQ